VPLEASVIALPRLPIPELEIPIVPDNSDLAVQLTFGTQMWGDDYSPLGIKRALRRIAEQHMLEVPCILMQTGQGNGFREGISQPIPLDPGVGADMGANVAEDDFEVDLLRPALIFFLEDFAVADGDAEAALVIELKLKGPQEHPLYSTSWFFLPLSSTRCSTLQSTQALVKKFLPENI
jgi:hypothetical protein